MVSSTAPSIFFPVPSCWNEKKATISASLRTDRLLTQALAQADQAQLLHLDMLDKNYILVKSFLEGYDEVQKILTGGSQRLEFNAAELTAHQQLVGREAEAVYLKDVRLKLPFPWPAKGLELGDCQGSDSPIPQHLAQVQNYLIGADLVIYVVSSRIGLRQADYKFLTDLKRMRLWENCVFVLNLDLNELENLSEAQDLVERWQRELTVFQTESPVFTFSGLDLLLHRLKEQGQSLSPKDQGMLQIWETDAALSEFSRRQAARFEEYLQKILTTRQTRLLLSSSLGQLQTVSQGLKERILLQEKFLGEDVSAFQTIRDRLHQRRQPLESLLYSLGQALHGAVYDLKQQLRSRLDKFFDARHGEVGPEISRFIEKYQADLNSLELGDQINSFMPGLYQVYQGFQQRLLLFLTEEVNLKILEFLRIQEKWLQDELTKVLEPLLVPLQDSLNLYYQEIDNLGIKASVPIIQPAPWVKPEEMQPKLFSLELGLNLRLRSQAMLLFGINLVSDTLKKLKKLWSKQETADQSKRLKNSLADALKNIKAHTQEEMVDNLLSYSEGLKFQYFFPLMEYLTKEQENSLKSALAALLVDLEGVQEAISHRSHQKEVWRRQLAELAVEVERFEINCMAMHTAYSPVSPN